MPIAFPLGSSSIPAAPAAAPKPMGTPLQRITRAVIVQMRIVSMNTSKIPKYP